MSVTIARRGGSTAKLGSTITVGAPAGATINQRLRGGLFGFADQANSPNAAAAAHAGETVAVRRIDGMMNYTPIKVGGVDGAHPTLGHSGAYSYNWTLFDADIAANAAEGAAELYLCLTYCPQLLGGGLPPSTATPFEFGWYRGPGAEVPNDPEAWGTMCADAIHHGVAVAAGLGLDVVYVGVGNEPDSGFFAGTATQYIEDLYAPAALAVKAAVPAVKVGGPELAGLTPTSVTARITAMLIYCKANAVPLDFLSWHDYEGSGCSIAQCCSLADQAVDMADWLTPLDYLIGEYASAQLANTPGYSPPFGTSATERLTINDQSASMGAIILMECQAFGIARSILWASLSQPATNQSGFFNANGPTANGNVLKLWERMGEAEVLAVTFDADPGIHAMAAEGDDGTLYVWVVSHHYRRGPTYNVTIELPDGTDGRAVTRWLIDRYHANQWDVDAENAEMEPVGAAAVAGEQVRVTLQARSVCMLEIAP